MALTLGARLSALGVGPGDRVGVQIESGTAELYVAVLGVLQSGAAYVPVDADDPPARAADLFERSGACAVVRDGLTIELRANPRGADRQPELNDDAWGDLHVWINRRAEGRRGQPPFGGCLRRRRGATVEHRA